MLTIPSRVVASCFALTSFAAAVVIGAAVGNGAMTVLGRALVVMLVCWAIGRAIGAIVQQVVDGHIERCKQENPVPGSHATDTAATQPGETDTAETESAAVPS